MALHLLPSEIINMIMSMLSIADLKLLCQTSRETYDLTAPFLFQTLTIRVNSHRELPLDYYGALSIVNRKVVSFARRVIIEPIPFSSLEARRSYKALMYSSHVSNAIGHDCEKLGRELLPLLIQLKNDSIYEFEWDYLDCLPLCIFGSSGILSLYQHRIRSLSFRTSGQILTRQSPSLGHFKNLRSLSFRLDYGGVDTDEDVDNCQAITTIIQSNHDTLESLELSCTFVHSGVYQLPQLLSYDLQPRIMLSSLNALNKLSLSSVTLSRVVARMVATMNFSNLKSLILRDCTGVSHLLEAVATSNLQINLHHIEIMLEPQHPESIDIRINEMLAIVLGKFRGLVDLFLKVPGPAVWDRLCESISGHKETLRHLILHARLKRPQGINIHDFETSWSMSKVHVLSSPGLDFVGLSDDCELLLEKLAPLKIQPGWRVLHVRNLRDRTRGRQSVYLEEFAEWAFGPDGLLSLQIIVCGDFNNKQMQQFAVSFCRRSSESTSDGSPSNFREVTSDDHYLQQLIRNLSFAIRACPF